MKLRPDEIANILKAEIERYEVEADVEEVGTVIEVGDGIARVYGLDNAAWPASCVEFGHGVFGLALNLEEDNVGVVLLGDVAQDQGGRAGPPHRRHHARCPSATALVGRVVDAARPADRRQGPDRDRPSSARSSASRPASSTASRVKEPLQTGIKAIDAMIPIGRGQRELIIGDRQTGKTAIALDTIINQKGKGVICIYVAIGQKTSTVAQVVEDARASTARWTTRSSSPPPRPTRRRCSTSRRTPAARWASTSCTTSSTR